METLFISKDCKISRADNTLLITPKEGKKVRVPIHGLHHMVVSGEAGLTTSLLALLGHQGVRITVLDWHGNVAGCYEPHNQIASGAVRIAQAHHASTPNLRLDLARRIVKGAATNILTNLRQRKYQKRPHLDTYIQPIEKMMASLSQATSIESLMGMEGNIHNWYYDAWPAIDQQLAFGKRTRRPPNNPINCLLSWYNSLVYTACRNEASKTHLDNCLSFLHSPQAARASLALDIAEIFKPAMTDVLIQETVLRGENTESWFDTSVPGVCLLTPTGRRHTLEKWTHRLDTRNQDKPSFRDLMRAEALAIERHVLGIAPYTPWKRSI